jgi:hypothetical protein
MKLALIAIALAVFAPLAGAAEYSATPETFAQAYIAAVQPGDVVVLEDGRYSAWWINGRSGITYRARNRHGASLQSVTVGPDNRSISLVDLDVSGSAHRGVVLDGGTGTTLEGLRVHHNASVGIRENDLATRTTIRDCEVFANGSPEREAAGIQVSGRAGLVTGNSVHDNSGYGVLCWNGCHGSASGWYEITRNEVFRNAFAPNPGHEPSELGVGGYTEEGHVVSDGLVHYVRVTDNIVRDGPHYGIYVLCDCPDSYQGEGVEIARNTVTGNTWGQIRVARCVRLKGLSIHDNQTSGAYQLILPKMRECRGGWR